MAYSAIDAADKDADSPVTVDLIDKLDTNPFQDDSPLKAGAGASMVLLSTATASASADLEFTGIDGTYDKYLWIFSNMLPATDAVGFTMQVSDDAGSTFKTTGYRYTSYGSTFASVATESSSSGAYMLLSSNNNVREGIDNLAGNGGCSGHVWMTNPDAVQRVVIYGQSVHMQRTSVYPVWNIYSADYNSQTFVCDAVRFRMVTGNITSGVVRMYGIKDS